MMPDWWGVLVVIVVSLILLVVFIGGLKEMVNDLRGETMRFKI